MNRIRALISYCCISQGSVAIRLGGGGIFNDHFIANFTESVPVKEFLKSFNIWWRYGHKYGVSLFDSRRTYRCKIVQIKVHLWLSETPIVSSPADISEQLHLLLQLPSAFYFRFRDVFCHAII